MGRKKAFPFPAGTGSVSGRPGLFREGRGHSPVCLEAAALPPDIRCSWRGGAELHAIPQHSPNEALIPQEQRAEPHSCSPVQGFQHKGFELGSAGFTKDGHENMREQGVQGLPKSHTVQRGQVCPCAQVKARIEELVHPRIPVTCKRRSTPKLGFIQHSLD